MYDGEIAIDEFLADRFEDWDAAQLQIGEGSRNTTMSHYAGRIISGLAARTRHTSSFEGYIPPEQYNQDFLLMP